MNDHKKCSRCGADLPASATGVCPRCAADFLQATQTDIPGEKNGAFTPPGVAELAAKFPQLEIFELIGRGGMGAVYKARQRELDRIVALKILPPDIGKDGAFAERFSREARALAKLNHPGIVTIYDFGRADGLYFFLMEFVDGMNLRELLQHGRISAREALAIVPQICDALQFAHDQGIVHRDIKPENLLIDRRGRVKVADFGLAKLMGAEPEPNANASGITQSTALTEAGKVMGTPNYMSPEQLERPEAVDHRADIFALGVVFYQMLTGELPNQPLERPSQKVQIDVRLDDVVLRALEKQPERRYQQASAFKTQVETIAGGATGAGAFVSPAWYRGVDYKSKRTLFGLPLLHVASGMDPVTGRARVARGIIAIGGVAQGVVAVGGVAMGGIALGGLSLGIFSYGGLALGVVALGGVAVALLIALGGMAVAPVSLGGMAVGYYSKGGLAIGYYYAQGGLALGAGAGNTHGPIPAILLFIAQWARPMLEHFQIINLWMVVLVVALASGLPWWLGRRAGSSGGEETKPGRGISPGLRHTWPILLVVLVIALLAGLVLRQLPVTNGMPRPSLADNPFELKKCTTDEVIAAALSKPDEPWAWQELQARAANGGFKSEANPFMEKLTAWAQQLNPNGNSRYNAWLENFLKDLTSRNWVAETNAVSFMTAYCGNPPMEPLPRIQEGERDLDFLCHLRSPWNNGFFGLRLLNDVQAVTVDGRPVVFKNPYGRDWESWDYNGEITLPALAPGKHVVRCEVVNILAAPRDLTGLPKDAPVEDWPPAKHIWTNVCESELMVYAKDIPPVKLVDDPALNPVIENALGVDAVIVRHHQGHLSAMVQFKMKAVPAAPISTAVTLQIGGQSIKSGSLMCITSADGKTTMTQDKQLTADFTALDSQVRTANIVLTPDTNAMASQAGVDRLWGKEIIFTNVPVNRLDLPARESSMP